MQLPVMPPVAPMLAKPVERRSRTAATLRAEVGRLPLDRLPGRRRGGDRQPQRAADDPLLPRARRGGAGELAGALRHRRRDRGRRTPRDGWTSRRCSSASTRRRAGSGCWPRRRRPHFVAFDLLALGDDDLTRRAVRASAGRWLEQALASGRARRSTSPPRPRTPSWRGGGSSEFEGAGLDGVSPSRSTGTYQPDKRVMFKIKHERTADCVVAGLPGAQVRPGRDRLAAAGLYDDAGVLAIVGVVGAFPMATRRELFEELQPLVTTFEGHPWTWARPGSRHPHPARGRSQPVERRQGPVLRAAAARAGRRGPLRPHGRPRFRHTRSSARWRPDRDPRSCTYEQLERPVRFDLAEIVPGLA